ncbi:hypothetical protein WOLCODRAFT_147083 [Wolfiporia cocos MD-104 SS10]|uniref:HMG box domain-containing protein n=1 Tax=Wolfiporia cocos (strain MD-104) TaxID=742152 RepID=A0A2H3J8I3_WOLCO|nr:hypothetical protein WOLCODRAFT_147083 [Wolfiporia cocos MD-104 SS10]
MSGSENGSTYAYLPGLKSGSELDVDPHMALTSQTLNADGTPKRPMNAFMIFARKRRPEISAANQMMRTGDVSKILSREWNTMSMSEKKFYLDQAKKLKDNFNSKYPDYVYRRRPNNSRRKRKPDPDHDATPEHPSALDMEDAMEEISPIGTDDIAIDSQGYQYGVTSPYGGHSDYASSQSSNLYSNTGVSISPRYGQQPAPTTHSSLPYSLQSMPGVVGEQRLPPIVNSNTMSQGFHGSLTLGHSSVSYPSSEPPSGSDLWDGSRTNETRTSWPLLPALDTDLARQRARSLAGIKWSDSPELSYRSWSATTPSTPFSSSSSSPGRSANANAAFPTLTSPFVPNPSPPQSAADSLQSPSSRQNIAPEYHSPSSPLAHRGMASSGRNGDGQQHRGFTQSNVLPLPSANPYQSHTVSNQFDHIHSQYRTTPGSPSLPPPLFPITTMSPQSTSPAATSSSSSASGPGSASNLGFWERQPFDGR